MPSRSGICGVTPTQGNVQENPEQLCARVARAIAHAELLLGNREQSALWEERFFKLWFPFLEKP